MKTAIAYYSKHHGNTKKLLDAIAAAAAVDLIDVTSDKNADLSGYDTFGPFKLVGGLAKGHPTADEIRKAVEFYKNLE